VDPTSGAWQNWTAVVPLWEYPVSDERPKFASLVRHWSFHQISASLFAHTRTRRDYYLCPDCLSIHRDIQD